MQTLTQMHGWHTLWRFGCHELHVNYEGVVFEKKPRS